MNQDCCHVAIWCAVNETTNNIKCLCVQTNSLNKINCAQCGHEIKKEFFKAPVDEILQTNIENNLKSVYD
jgi:hypothetical protein